MAQVEPIYVSTTMILMLKDGKEIGNATGFFYTREHDNKLFLITNKHVIYGKRYYENPPIEINKFRLNLHTNSNNLSENELIEVPLFDAHKNKLWLEHSNPNVDVVVLPVEIDRKKYVISPIDDSLFDCQNLVISS